MTTSAGAGTTRSDRVGAIILLVFALAYGFEASRIAYSFSSDPLGPRVFPLVLSGLLAVLSLIYLLRPSGAQEWPRGKLLLASLAIPGLVLVSALLLEPLGFAIATTVMVVGVGRIFGASWRAAIIGGVVQAALWFVIFRYLLDVYLPGGSLLGL